MPPDLLSQEETALYDDWKRYGHHLEEYAAELAGTLFLMLFVVGGVAWLFGHGSPLLRALPSPPLRLFLLGLVLGGASALVALSPPGRLSGAHLNPAASLGFWVLGKMHARDFAGYVAGQMAGAAAGGLLGAALFGWLARSAHDATLTPGPDIGWWPALLAEVGTTFVLMLLVYTCVSHKRLARWTPLLSTLLLAALIALDGNYSGCGMNPARWFGPAVAAEFWRLGWVYVLGPLLGAGLAAWVRRTGRLTHPMPHTGKLFHDTRYRSLFRHDSLPTTPPKLPPHKNR